MFLLGGIDKISYKNNHFLKRWGLVVEITAKTP